MKPWIKRLTATLVFLLFAHQASAFFGLFSRKTPRAEQLAVVYLPHPAMPVGGARPLPTYDALWTPERMLRDTRRIASLGATRVVLVLDPALALAEPNHLEECIQFITLAAQNGLQTSLLLGDFHDGSALPTRAEQQRLVEWVKSLPMRVSRDALTQVDGRILCLTPASAPAWRVLDPALLFVRIEATTPLPYPSLSPPGETWLFVPVPERLPGYSSRNLERDFRRNLAAIETDMRIDVLCIVSWNNYADGTVIEPNTRDGDRLYQFLADWADDYLGATRAE